MRGGRKLTLCFFYVFSYASPQLLRLTNTGNPYPAANGWSDLWAVGILVHGLLTGFFPFRSEDPVELDREIRSTWKNASEFEGVPGHEISAECRAWIHALLDPANEGKFTTADLLAHPWLNSKPDANIMGWPAPHRPVPLLPESSKDHRRLAKLVADHLQDRLPAHRAEMKRILLPIPVSLPAPKPVSAAMAMSALKPSLPPSLNGSSAAFTHRRWYSQHDNPYQDHDMEIDFYCTHSDATIMRTPSPFAPSDADTAATESFDDSPSSFDGNAFTGRMMFTRPSAPTPDSLRATASMLPPNGPSARPSHGTGELNQKGTVKRWFAKLSGRV
jgi:serine/threonine protein kinase